MAVNDTLKDVSSFSNTYSKFGYTNIIANGEYLPTGLNFPLPGTLTALKKTYKNFLTADDMTSLTTPTSIVDIVAATNALLSKYNPATAITRVDKTNGVRVFSTNGRLQLSNLEQGSKVSVYSAGGQLLISREVSSTVLDIPAKGFVVVKVNSAKNSEVVKAFVK